MTGRDLIIYILSNNLENEEIFKDGKLLGCMSVQDAAVALGTGTATIEALIKYGHLKTFKLYDNVYILPSSFNDLKQRWRK